MNVKNMTTEELWAWMLIINTKELREKVYSEIKLREQEKQNQ